MSVWMSRLHDVDGIWLFPLGEAPLAPLLGLQKATRLEITGVNQLCKPEFLQLLHGGLRRLR